MTHTRYDSKQVQMTVAILLIVLGLFCFFGNREVVEKWTLKRELNLTAARQVDEALEKNLAVFAAISAIKASVALVEGSSVGVGFDLEVGDLVQPAYDYIDFIWRLFLYAVLVLTFYKLVVDSGILGLGIQILAIGFVLWGLSLIVGGKRREIRAWAGRFIRVGLLVAYAVPVVLLASHFLSERFTAPLKEKTAARIYETQYQFLDAKDDFLSLKDQVSLMHPAESVEKVRLACIEVIQRVTAAAWDSMRILLYYVSILLFDLLILPVLMALLVYTLFRLSMGRLEARGINIGTPCAQG